MQKLEFEEYWQVWSTDSNSNQESKDSSLADISERHSFQTILEDEEEECEQLSVEFF